MHHDLNIAQRKLADFMSELSERCYTAGWMENLEYVLWETIISGPRKYGQSKISEHDIERLTQLSGNCNCWVYFDDTREETSVNLNEWIEVYNKVVSLNPNIIQREV